MCWNKGSALLQNRMLEIKQIIHDYKPMVLAINEAQIRQGDTVSKEVEMDGYTLYKDGLYLAGQTARSCVYASNELTVTQRTDLQQNNLALVALTLGRPRQKKINIISFYRQ